MTDFSTLEKTKKEEEKLYKKLAEEKVKIDTDEDKINNAMAEKWEKMCADIIKLSEFANVLDTGEKLNKTSVTLGFVVEDTPPAIPQSIIFVMIFHTDQKDNKDIKNDYGEMLKFYPDKPYKCDTYEPNSDRAVEVFNDLIEKWDTVLTNLIKNTEKQMEARMKQAKEDLKSRREKTDKKMESLGLSTGTGQKSETKNVAIE